MVFCLFLEFEDEVDFIILNSGIELELLAIENKCLLLNFGFDALL